MALLIGGVYLPHTSAQHKYTAAKERSKATAAAKGEDFAAAGQEMWENTAHSPNPGLRPVYADAHLSPSDEYGFDDTIAAFAIQYGFVIGFAAAMPALSVLALAINVALLRASAFKMLWVSRREWPFTASGLGVWDKMLETLTVLAAFSNGWLIADLMDCYVWNKVLEMDKKEHDTLPDFTHASTHNYTHSHTRMQAHTRTDTNTRKHRLLWKPASPTWVMMHDA